MSGADDVAVVWVAPAEGRDDAVSALAEWARVRGVALLSSPDGRDVRPLRVELAVSDRIEKELERAREAIAALDADPAERALARAEATLREHPELPQAAWLRAEVHRAWAARWSRVEPRDDARAELAWQEADALDGGRVAGVGEIAHPLRRAAAATFAVSGGTGHALGARLDGVELEGVPSPDGATRFTVDVRAAEHQLVITLDGEAVFASWISIAEAQPGAQRAPFPISLGETGVCGAAALGGVTRDADGNVHASGVACGRWIAVAPGDRPGAVLVARCERDACGPFLEWRAAKSLESPAPRERRIAPAPWPAWATWTAVGVGVLAAGVTTVIATGVLETRPVETRFVAGGVRIE